MVRARVLGAPEERRAAMLDRHARTVVLVGCGKATSPLFKKSVELAELVGDAVYVTSASKVLAGLEEAVEPDERKISSLPRWARAGWGEDVVRELVMRTLGSPSRIRVVLLMGCAYADPIVRAIAKAGHGTSRWSEPVDLLRGLQIGERLTFLGLALSTVWSGGTVRGLSRRLLDTSPARV